MMKLLLACVTVALLAQEAELVRSSRRRKGSVAEYFQDTNICPSIISQAPKNLLNICYDDNSIDIGSTVNYEDTNCQLSIEFDDYEPGYYTLVILDGDFPCADNAYGSPLLLGLIVNINDIANCFDSGVVLASYQPPLLQPGCGPKRIIFVLYKQTNQIDSANCVEGSYEYNRYQFDLTQYVSENNLCDPVAGNSFNTCLCR